jgi:hypothetical protein
MITRLKFMNFRSHANTETFLQPMTLLIGPVAGGKSNVFKGMLLIQNSVHRSLIELFPPGLGEFHWVRSRWAAVTDPIGFEIDVDSLPSFLNQRARYTLKIMHSPAGLYVLEETLQRQVNDERWEWVFERRDRGWTIGNLERLIPMNRPFSTGYGVKLPALLRIPPASASLRRSPGCCPGLDTFIWKRPH